MTDEPMSERLMALADETISAIEVSFAAPVALSSSHQRRLVELMDDICKAYERRHPERTMWAAGIGQKMLTNPFMADDEHPMRFDESVFTVECFEREYYARATLARDNEGE